MNSVSTSKKSNWEKVAALSALTAAILSILTLVFYIQFFYTKADYDKKTEAAKERNVFWSQTEKALNKFEILQDVQWKNIKEYTSITYKIAYANQCSNVTEYNICNAKNKKNYLSYLLDKENSYSAIIDVDAMSIKTFEDSYILSVNPIVKELNIKGFGNEKALLNNADNESKNIFNVMHLNNIELKKIAMSESHSSLGKKELLDDVMKININIATVSSKNKFYDWIMGMEDKNIGFG